MSVCIGFSRPGGSAARCSARARNSAPLPKHHLWEGWGWTEPSVSAFRNKTPWLASGTDQEQGFRCWWLCEGTATGGCLPDEELLPPDFHFWLLWVPEVLIKSFPTRSPDSAPPPPAISSSFPGLWGPALPKASLVQGEKKPKPCIIPRSLVNAGCSSPGGEVGGDVRALYDGPAAAEGFGAA